MLDLKRLRLLHELHRRGTVGAVAEALSYSPSTVSQQLQVLQREAGTALFEPAGRNLRLTDAALVLVAHAEELLAAVERAEGDLEAAAAGAVAGVVRVGSFQTASLHLLLPVMTALENDHPGVEIRLVESETDAGARGAALAPARPRARRRVDRARRARACRGSTATTCSTSTCSIAVPRDHPAAADATSASTTSPTRTGPPATPAAACPSSCGSVCNGHGGFEPRIRHHTNELGMLLALVEHGQAVTLLPEIALVDAPAGVAARPIAGPRLGRTVFTAARTGADRRPALAAVRDALRAAAAIRPGLPSSPAA